MNRNGSCPMFVAAILANPDPGYDPFGSMTKCLGDKCAWIDGCEEDASKEVNISIKSLKIQRPGEAGVELTDD